LPRESSGHDADPAQGHVRFTGRARRVIVLAQHEARELGHGFVGTEHLLLGLLAEGEGVAALALESLGISLEETRDQVEEIAGRGQGTPAGHLPLTPRAKQALERALREAVQLGHNYVGTEHLLLSLLAEGDGTVAHVLAGRGAGYDLVRERVVALLADVTEQLRQVQRQKTAAFEAGDHDGAAALRGRERQLRAEKLRLEAEWQPA
jgi:ATP-dependent Clp protease ATP-binding subunit ClpC